MRKRVHLIIATALALSFCFTHIVIGKPIPTFPQQAPADQLLPNAVRNRMI